jgi:preprotein translocase SecE subunit
MAVAVRNTPETTSSPKLFDHLAVSITAGVAYVIASIWVVFYGLPSLWWNILGYVKGFAPDIVPPEAPAVYVALLFLIMLVAGIGLFVIGFRLMASYSRPGLRSGIFFGLLGVLVALEVASALGAVLYANDVGKTLGIALSALLCFAVLAGTLFAFTRAGCEGWLIAIEDQGWFSSASYKRSQGLRMRRATILGILILAGCGIYTLLAHHTLQTGPRNWSVPIPYTESVIPILPHVSITLPLVLGTLSLWLAYRVVNFPVFADFLIATEAEMNKVSWTTRRRLVQDTIVVLVTVALLTLFLFVVDQGWAWMLTRVGVVQLPNTTAQQAAQREPSW